MIVLRKEIDPRTYEGFNPKFIRLLPNTILEDYCFYDIETTGFDPEFSRYAMTGIFYFKNNKWYMEQYLAESKSDEEVVVRATLDALLHFPKVVTYNGDDFDLPYLFHKLRKLGLDFSEEIKKRSVDLYKLTKPLKKKYNFFNCKLKTIEKFLGINRKFFIEGDLLAEYYTESVKGSTKHFEEYMGYNEEDVVYLAQLMSDFAEDYFPESTGDDGQLSLF